MKESIKKERTTDRSRGFLIYFILESLQKNGQPMRATQILEDINKRYGENTIAAKTDTIVSHISKFNNFLSNTLNTEPIIGITCGESGRYNNNRHYYLVDNNGLDETEINILIGLLYDARSLSKKVVYELINKLKDMQNICQVKEQNISDGSSYSTNQQGYINYERIKKAIENQYNIKFDYYEYNLNKQLVKRTRNYEYIVSPLLIHFSRGQFFLIGYHIPTEKIRTYRLDKIKEVNAEKDESLGKYRKDKLGEAEKLLLNSAFMHVDSQRVNVELRCEYSILDDVIERFENCNLRKDLDSDRHFIAMIPNASVQGMKYWILEFSSACEVLSPKQLRDDIKNILKRAVNWYET